MSELKNRQAAQPYLSVTVENVEEVAANIGYTISALGDLVAAREEMYSTAKLQREITVAEVSEMSTEAIAAKTGKRPTEKQLEIACLTSEAVKQAYADEFAAKRQWQSAKNLLQDYYSTANMVPALIGRINLNARIESQY